MGSAWPRHDSTGSASCGARAVIAITPRCDPNLTVVTAVCDWLGHRSGFCNAVLTSGIMLLVNE